MEKHNADGINELTEILARGYLRLILRQKVKVSANGLKQLDKPAVASD